MSALDGWIDICRAGTWRDQKGDMVKLTEDSLDRMVSSFATGDPVPVVAGHPQTDAPAQGWIASVRRVGDRLQAKLRDIAPAFRRDVEAGRYAGRSIAFEGDRLRHLGFLGARRPAVPGLTPSQFAAPTAPGATAARNKAVATAAREAMASARARGEVLSPAAAVDQARAGFKEST